MHLCNTKVRETLNLSANLSVKLKVQDSYIDLKIADLI